MLQLDRISIEPSRQCSKACAFCYNGSGPDERGAWSAPDLIDFVRDCARNQVRAVSFGGGEPLEWPPIFETLRALDGTLFRSVTTNGLPLADRDVFARLVTAHPDKVHVSVHSPERPREVLRVAQQVVALARAGIASGVNLLVRRSCLAEATAAAETLHRAGIGNDRIVYLPLRGSAGDDTPTPDEVARVADGPFQSMTCLSGCARSPRFVSIAADRTVAWCSYTPSRHALTAPTWTALTAALEDLSLANCADGLVRLSTGRQSVGAGST